MIAGDNTRPAYQKGLRNLQGPMQDENAGLPVQNAEEKFH